MTMLLPIHPITTAAPPLCVEETVTGKRGIVDLWYYFYESTGDASLRTAQAALMTADETERLQRFRFERDRRQFLATRALVRTVLSGYTSVEPGAWRFVVDEHGKPHIDQPRVHRPIFFNLANTLGLVVCAVSLAHQLIGVDVERTNREIDISDLAENYFSGPEVRTLRALPVSEQRRQFFAYWTLKESYIKAKGKGLALPLDRFSFFADQEEIGAILEGASAVKARDWKFALLGAPQHILAVAVKTSGTPLSLRSMHLVPLGGSKNVKIA
jgi:4'-phosphopantetheinyl transferase